MINSILYTIFGGNAALVRMAKGAVAFGVAAAGTYIANNAGGDVASGEIPELVGAALGVLALGLDKLASIISPKE